MATEAQIKISKDRIETLINEIESIKTRLNSCLTNCENQDKEIQLSYQGEAEVQFRTLLKKTKEDVEESINKIIQSLKENTIAKLEEYQKADATIADSLKGVTNSSPAYNSNGMNMEVQ